MRQSFRLDRPACALYLALGVAGCTPGAPGPVVPVGATVLSAEEVGGWAAATRPESHRLHRFKWLFKDERSSAGGRGSVRIAPPDSFRLDVAGPLGAGASSGVVVGDSTVWVDPPDAIRKLVPSFPLMWALVGVAQSPAAGTEVRGLQAEDVTAWEYADGADTVSYALSRGGEPRLVAEVRSGGKVLGRATTKLDPRGMPLTSRLVVPDAPAQLDLTFTASNQAPEFDAGTWAPRQP